MDIAQSVQEIVRIGRERAPHECCGLIASRVGQDDLDGDVLELPNESSEPLDSYAMSAGAMQEALLAWAHEQEVDSLGPVLVWHTHPSGRVGPSRGDLRARVPGVKYMVVTLDGQAVRY